MKPEEICNVIMSAEREGGRIMLGAKEILAQCKTGSRDVVTQYDIAVQQHMEEYLAAALPGVSFFCEESSDDDSLSADRIFIIDPIDGTMNFVHGFSCSAISTAYAENGKIVCGAVYNPYLDEMFSAVKGHGAFLNGKRIHVNDSQLSESVVCFGTSPYRQELHAPTFELAAKVMGSSLDLRRFGSAALDLCEVAAGRAGLYFEYMVSLWDYAAGMLIVNEAGGQCSRIDGTPLPLGREKPTIVAGGERALTDFFALK